MPVNLVNIKYNISAIILAAGTSSRFDDKNKLLQPFGNNSILEHVVKTITNLPILEVILVTGYEHERITKSIIGYNIRVVHNTEFESGIASSIKCGISSASKDTEGFMICMGDMPYITIEFIQTLLDTFLHSLKSIVVPAIHSRRGNPVIFSKNFKDDLLKIEGDKGARDVTENHSNSVIEVPIKKETYFLDVDTLEDLAGLFKSQLKK